MGAPTKDWQPSRLGANPPDSLVDLSDKASAAAREGFRRFLHGTVTPLPGTMAREAAHKLATPGLALDTTGLHAADVQGRAGVSVHGHCQGGGAGRAHGAGRVRLNSPGRLAVVGCPP